MLYNIGDILVCKDTVNAQCLEMSNPDFDIMVGDQYKVTDKDDFPDDHHCHWYELTSEKDKSIVLNAWNDSEHMIIDDKFIKDMDMHIWTNIIYDIKEKLQERIEYYGDDENIESKIYKEVLEIIESDIENLKIESYRVLYKEINSGFQLSDDMDFDAACQFRNKCLDMGYNTAYVIQIVE